MKQVIAYNIAKAIVLHEVYCKLNIECSIRNGIPKCNVQFGNSSRLLRIHFPVTVSATHPDVSRHKCRAMFHAHIRGPGLQYIVNRRKPFVSHCFLTIPEESLPEFSGLSTHGSEVQVGSLSQLLRIQFSRHCFRNVPGCVQDKITCHVPCARPWSRFAVHCQSSETLCFPTVFNDFRRNVAGILRLCPRTDPRSWHQMKCLKKPSIS